MRVLQIHNRYKYEGGEDIVVNAESRLLRKNKNKVNLFEVSNDTIKGVKAKIQTAFNACNSNKYKHSLVKKIREFQPDLVHVHNFFPLLTPSIYDVCRSSGVSIVQTLHNYRIICPGAYLMRNGKICEECLARSAYNAVLYGCYRGSRIGSLAAANMVQVHRKRQTWLKQVDQYIAMTNFAKKKFVQAGILAEKIQIKPNFLNNDPGIRSSHENYALFVGRLSNEKGILTLFQCWEKIREIPLKIIGEGPLLESLKKIRTSKNLYNIQLLGRYERKKVFQVMKSAMFILYPSEWYEMFGLICIEAFACGKPVIASRLGSMAEIVEDGVTGLHFEPGNSEDFAMKIQWLINHPNECRYMGENARKVYLEKYTADKNYKILMKVYNKALS